MKNLLSILVPAYNVEAYLGNCLESLIGQTYANLEIIVVNDGSSDNTGTLADTFAERDSRVAVIHQDNAGVSAARNAGLKQASGDYIMFVDGDDWLDIETCFSALEALQLYAADVVLFDYVREFKDRSEAKHFFKGELIEFDEAAVRSRLHRRLVGLVGAELATPENADAIAPVWGKLYKASLVKGVQFFDLSDIGSNEDGLFNLQLFATVKRAVYMGKPFYHYRKVAEGSITTRYRPDLSSQWMHLFELITNELQRQQVGETYFQALDNRVALSIIGLGLNECGNPAGHLARIRNVKAILSTPAYRKAYRHLPFRYFPVHWKLFFACAKLNRAVGVYMLSRFINRLLRR